MYVLHTRTFLNGHFPLKCILYIGTIDLVKISL